ncbi:MAG: hypothetical protein OXC62_05345 [Aestuariivita sp.]|nr:hypothetical protein [Aestuariivita sp.]
MSSGCARNATREDKKASRGGTSESGGICSGAEHECVDRAKMGSWQQVSKWTVTQASQLNRAKGGWRACSKGFLVLPVLGHAYRISGTASETGPEGFDSSHRDRCENGFIASPFCISA